MKRKSIPPQETSSDSSDSVDIQEIAQSVVINSDEKYVKTLEDNCRSLKQTVDALLRQMQDKDDELVQLKSMLQKSVSPLDTAVPMEITDEEIIALNQLQRLKEAAKARELTLDEIKRFDLLVKNKRLAQGNATSINANGLPHELGTSELLKIAQKTTRRGG